MKRFIFLILSLIFIVALHPENKGFSRWSFAPEYGYNKLDGDLNSVNLQLVPSSLQQISYGANLEYGITPVWGLSLDYYFMPLTGKNNLNSININTNLYTSDLNATINLTRLLFPQTKSRIYLNGSLGLGYAYYTFNKTSLTKGIDLKNGQAYSIPITVSLEYNLSKTLAFGTKVQYRAFNKDDLEGVTSMNFKGNSNDFVGTGTLFLRYKFNSVKKDHLRNVKNDVYSPDNGLLQSKLNEEKISKLDKEISKLEEIVTYQNRLLDSMSVYIASIGSTLNGVGVQNVSDPELNTTFNSSFDSNKGSQNNRNTSKLKESIEDIPSVYFDFNKTDLDDKALVAISKIAKKLKSDPNLYVEVRGYCDMLDTENQNNQLSQRRSDRVKAELVNYWKIPYNHIITNGKVNVAETQLKSRPNRRCDIFFVKL